jgi:DNA-binding MarR family transcriptional regulator
MRAGNFFIIPNAIFERKLSPVTFYVYCYLKKCHNRKNGCYPSRQTISKACGISGSSVGRAVKYLEQAGLLLVRHNFGNGRQMNNSYELLSPDIPSVHGEPSPSVTER